MGSFDVTCAVSNTRIEVAEPVRVFTTCRGVKYEQRGSSSPALMFGFPFLGQYADYGDADNYQNQPLVEFTEKAFGNTPFFKPITLKSSASWRGPKSIWLAKPATITFGHEDYILPMYLAKNGISLLDKDNTNEANERHSLVAFRQAKADLEQLATLLDTDFPDDELEFNATINKIFQDVFGSYAWFAFQALWPHFKAMPDEMFVKESVYQAVISEWGNRKFRKGLEKHSVPVREFLQACYTTWDTAFTDAIQNPIHSSNPRVAQYFRDAVATEQAEYLQPLTKPWMSSKVPLQSNFWDAVTPADVQRVLPVDDILDFATFQWALGYMRIKFVDNSSTWSQNMETKLYAKAVKAGLKGIQHIADF